ncbi:MAG TPA: hypothetical protein VIO64_22460 [Pseudobacteroides sp.]|uniref:hypothetical protein n=1 Tax=Pseudobacteroides sp. TaxID=1968840 RepID=UPI002F9467AE
MNIGKKEIKLLVILGVILYGFVFYLVFVNNYIPEINVVNAKLSEAKEKESALEKDLENIDQKKSELKTKNVVSERIGNYVPNSSDMYDPITYMIKLQKLVGNKLTDVKINQPEEVLVPTKDSDNKPTSNVEQVKSEVDNTGLGNEVTAPANAKKGTKYYSIAIDFKAKLAYNEILELLSYIEGGSRRIKISQFKVESKKESKNASSPPKATPVPNQTAGTVLNDVEVTIKLYTQDIEEANKLFNSSKNRYNKYDESSGLIFTISSNTGTTNNNSTAVRNNNSSTSSQNNKVVEPDFILEETGYFTAGENFLVRGIDKYNDFFRYKTAGRTDVQLTLTENKYTMIITYAVGKSKTISGSIPNRDLNADLKVDVGDIKENERIRVNYKITNNSSNKLHLNVFDPGGRIKVLDRSGNVVKGKSEREKVSIN